VTGVVFAFAARKSKEDSVLNFAGQAAFPDNNHCSNHGSHGCWGTEGRGGGVCPVENRG